MEITTRTATKADKQFIKKILQRMELSQEGVDGNNIQFLICEDTNNKKIAALAGVEKLGQFCFLRSLILEFNQENVSMGLDFIINTLQFARKLGCKEIYLLTLPKSKLFLQQLQFKQVEFNDLPKEIRNSKHFLRTYKPSVIIMRSY